MKAFRLLSSFLFVVLPPALAFGQAEQSTTRAFVGARIIDGVAGTAVENGALLVRDGKIVAIGAAGSINIPAGTERVNVTGKTIMPGIVNAHGHVGGNGLDYLRRYARYGVTTVVSLGGEGAQHIQIRDAQDNSGLNHARIYVAGPVITSSTPEAAIQAVDQRAEMKVDWIKIRVDDNLGSGTKMPEPVYRAIIEQSHRKSMRLAVHMFYLEDAKLLLSRGADLLAHSVRDKPVDAGLIGLMNDRNICITPTLTREVSAFVYETKPDFFSDPFFLREVDSALMDRVMSNSRSVAAYKDALAMASWNLKSLNDAGIRIAMGTDSGASENRFPGYFEHLELQLMAKAGMTPMQILKSATSVAAQCMGLGDRVGSLETGKWADFIVLGANPLADIKNTTTVESVWIAGNRVPAR